MHCPSCPEKVESFILYKTAHKKDEKYVKDVRCMSEIHSQPTLYKCKKCKLIFSEYINIDTEEAYTAVEDDRYIQQIPYKKKILNFYSVKFYLF